LLLGCNFAIATAREYGQVLASVGGKLQAFEPFVMLGSSKRDAMFILLGKRQTPQTWQKKEPMR
jgi:hypothetical protein